MAVGAGILANSCTALMPEHIMQKEKLLLRERWEDQIKAMREASARIRREHLEKIHGIAEK